MKKYIVIIALFLAISSPVHAQTAEELNTQLLRQVIALLEQQVALLMEQLKIVLEKQATVETKVDTVTTQVAQMVQNTTPSYGSVEPATPQIVKDIKIDSFECRWIEPDVNIKQFICGMDVTYTENGKNTDAIITVSSSEPTDVITTNNNYMRVGVRGFGFSISDAGMETFVAEYEDRAHLIPKSYSSKVTRTFTATANGVSKSMTYTFIR